VLLPRLEASGLRCGRDFFPGLFSPEGASIELRTPILDLEVAKVAARIPSDLKLRQGANLYFSRKSSMSRSIDLNSDFPYGFGSGSRVRDRIGDELLSPNSFISGRLQNARLRAAWRDLLTGWDGSRIFFALWSYEKWQRAVRTPTRATG
jgi:hypothetical protein